jgi:hypothetical protein
MKSTASPGIVSALQLESQSGQTHYLDQNNLFQCWALTSNKGKIRGRHLKMPPLFYSKADAVAYAQMNAAKGSPMPYICKFTLVPELKSLQQTTSVKRLKFRIL